MGDQGWPAAGVTHGAECAEMRRALGVYIVGAIGPADRGAVDEHLTGCADCRDELAALAGLPALMGRVPADEAARLLLGAEPDLPQPALASILDRAARLRGHRRWPFIATAAAAGLAIGAGAVTVSHVLEHPQGAAVAVAPRWAPVVHGADPRTHAAAIIKYQARPWGLQLAVQVRGVRAGTKCWLHVTNAQGQQVASGSWTVASGDQDAWYLASSSVPLSSARAFVITTGSRILVTAPIGK